MDADNRSLMELPKANLEGVLTRLPLQSLLVSCCVSKPLLNLIKNDSEFAKMHFARSESQLMIHSPENTNFHLIDLDADTTPALGARVEVKPSFNLPLHDFEVTHSCNGLLLLENMNRADEIQRYIVCNPVTGEYTMLPETIYYSRNVKCAFFYSPITNQFKVLCTFHRVFRLDVLERHHANQDSNASIDMDLDAFMELDPSTDRDVDFDSDSGTQLDLFSDRASNVDSDSDTYSESDDSYFYSDTDSGSMYSESDTMGLFFVGGSDSWEPLGHLPFSPLDIFSPCYFDKATHWLCADESFPILIVFFHFETHEFGEIPTPAHMGTTHTNSEDEMSLVVVGGFLSIFDGFTRRGKFDIWIMKEYGEWSKDYVIDTIAYGLYKFTFCYKPVIWRTNGEVVMIREDGHILLYDLVKKTGRVLKHPALELPFKPLIHIPSFISLREAMRGSNLEVLNVASRFGQAESNFPIHYLELSRTF